MKSWASRSTPGCWSSTGRASKASAAASEDVGLVALDTSSANGLKRSPDRVAATDNGCILLGKASKVQVNDQETTQGWVDTLEMVPPSGNGTTGNWKLETRFKVVLFAEIIKD